MPRSDWSVIDITLFLCFWFWFCFWFCLIRSLTISCFFFFCLELAVINAEVKSSESRRSRSLNSLFHIFVCWAEITTAHFRIEEDFEVKSSESRRSRELTFFCHIFVRWFSLLSLTISWFMTLAVFIKLWKRLSHSTLFVKRRNIYCFDLRMTFQKLLKSIDSDWLIITLFY